MDEPRKPHTAPPPTTPELVHEWCERSVVPGRHPELSDDAAVTIAAGHLPADARATVVRRIAAGLRLPSSGSLSGGGGFAELRRLHRSIVVVDGQLANPLMPSVVGAVVRTRRNTLARRLDDARRVVVGGKGVFASSIRGIRRERRDGTHLETDERERLFVGLTYTPTPDAAGAGYARRAGSLAVDRFAAALDAATKRSSRGRRWTTEVLGEAQDAFPPSTDSRFVDGYETMLFLAGLFFDRVMRCSAWHSEHFAVQRGQVDLHAELADIAADVIALRTIRVDLENSRRAVDFDADLDDHIGRREASLRPVWRELIERVAALGTVAEVVESAAVELRVLAEYAQTATIDDRIDDLVARSGTREMSADNSRRLSDQVRAGEEQLRVYRDVLQGNVLRVISGNVRDTTQRD